MKKMLSLLLIHLILITGMLGGCLFGLADSDGDGYPDDEDDFPNDPNLHKKEIIADVTDLLLSETTTLNKGWESDVSSNYKYVDVKIHFSGSVTALDHVQVFVLQPNGEYDHVYGQSTFIKRYPISIENSGKWVFSVYNTGYEPVYVDCYIVKVV